MKTFKMIGMLVVVLLSTIFLTNCSDEYDDSLLTGRIDNLENRLHKLEELCSQMNTNISSLQTIIIALQDRDYITNVSPIEKEGQMIGYTIAFAKNNSITIYHGKNGVDGSDGEDGKDGENGKNGSTPVIGVKTDVDGVYYWTVNGNWLFDEDGDKINSQGIDGEDGQNGLNGKNGITPKLKIENNYWYVSYDNAVTWMELGKTLGENGEDGSNGKDGDSMFKEISIEDGAVLFTLNDGSNTVLSIPFCKPTTFSVHIEEAGTLKKLLTDEEKRTTISLKVTGVINEDDMKTVNSQMLVLEYLDLGEASFDGPAGIFDINPYGISLVNRTLRKIVLPSSGITSLHSVNCLNLEELVVTSDMSVSGDYEFCDNLVRLTFTEGVNLIQGSCANFPIVEFSKMTNEVYYMTLACVGPKVPITETVICKAVLPPSVGYINTSGLFQETVFYDHYKSLSELILYVPAESVELYKNANAWKEFGDILPLIE